MMLLKKLLSSSMVFLICSICYAGDNVLKKINLPTPAVKGGMPLKDALRMRKSSRSYDTKNIPIQVLSDLLWAAFGVNRPESGKRTAPSARNWQEIDVYLTMEEGLYKYIPGVHEMVKLSDKDIRNLTGTQDFVSRAPLNIVFVADISRMKGADEDSSEFISAIDTGFISQNVYLFCASEGLSTVVRAMIDRESLSRAMGLKAHQKIIVAQTVGYEADR